MVCWFVEQNTVSNKSLMEMPKDLVKDAVTVRKSLLGYMGDKQMSFPETLAQNILMKGLDKPKIRDEVYLQVKIYIERRAITYIGWGVTLGSSFGGKLWAGCLLVWRAPSVLKTRRGGGGGGKHWRFWSWSWELQ